MERNKVSVLLVSVDALKPEFVFEQERLGISLPNICLLYTSPSPRDTR